jgi:hypothetical protein
MVSYDTAINAIKTYANQIDIPNDKEIHKAAITNQLFTIGAKWTRKQIIKRNNLKV